MSRVKIIKPLLQGLAGLVMIYFFSACSTQRNTWVNRNFHAINAKYNGYFNARENFRAGMKRLAEMHQDYFDQPLSIFRYGNDDQRRQIESNLDAAFQKSSAVIRRHSMLIRGVEHNPWIDDAYFIVAKSHFFRGDIHLANFTFEFIFRQYDTPLSYDALVWIAKGHALEGRFEEALRVLEIAGNNLQKGLMTDDGTLLYFLTFADLMAKQGFYERAIPHLINAIENSDHRREETRLTFILGQYFQFSGNFSLAQQTFEQVLNLSPGFELALQARINMALTYDAKTGNEAFIRSELNRMIRDSRNEPYLDRIYYAKARLAWRQNDHAMAINDFRESIRLSQANHLQKGLSYLRLGEIFFGRASYLEASVFYDSALTFLPAGYSNLDEIRKTQTILSGLAENIRLIQREDSLLTLANLDQAAREAVVDIIIAKKRERELAIVNEQQQRTPDVFAQETAGRTEGQQGGGWYFYNPAALNFGQAEFSSRFGNRPLEDMWRLSNRQPLAPALSDQLPAVSIASQNGEDANQERHNYMQNIPLTLLQQEESKRRIANAYFNKGIIFKDQLNDKTNAISAFETLINRFPDYENRLQVYYFLMNLWQESGNSLRTDFYINRIISDFPESRFARIIADPNFLENYLQSQSKAEQLYQETYMAFLAGDNNQVMASVRIADTIAMSRKLQSQFAYLKALSLGRLGMHDEFTSQLQYVVENFSETDVYQHANHLLTSVATKNRNLGTIETPVEQKPLQMPV
ncbi:MAG TPA: tetratricopeptide repeat protein, partial [Bacteroidales bacterium]|nr:tetratricopeptide repeat protein [Bacteroidales bacterium]